MNMPEWPMMRYLSYLTPSMHMLTGCIGEVLFCWWSVTKSGVGSVAIQHGLSAWQAPGLGLPKKYLQSWFLPGSMDLTLIPSLIRLLHPLRSPRHLLDLAVPEEEPFSRIKL